MELDGKIQVKTLKPLAVVHSSTMDGLRIQSIFELVLTLLGQMSLSSLNVTISREVHEMTAKGNIIFFPQILWKAWLVDF